MLTEFAVPPGLQTISSDDPDEVTSWVGHAIRGDHSRVVHGTGRYGFALARLRMQELHVAWARSLLANTLRGCFPRSTFHFPLRGTHRYSHGRQRFEVDAGALVFIPSHTELTRRSEGDPIVAIEIEAGAFATEMRRRQGTERLEWPRVPQVLQLTQPQQQRFMDAITAVLEAHAPDVAASGRAHGENQLLTLLADAVPQPPAGRITHVSTARLDCVEAWIDAHVGEVITLGRLCEVAHVGARALQVAFQSRRGMSPMRFVAERRLAAARRRFANAEAGDDVTAVATQLGFTHLGRFSIAYRAAFGESPSQTLQRSLRPRSTSVAIRPVVAVVAADGDALGNRA